MARKLKTEQGQTVLECLDAGYLDEDLSALLRAFRKRENDQRRALWKQERENPTPKLGIGELATVKKDGWMPKYVDGALVEVVSDHQVKILKLEHKPRGGPPERLRDGTLRPGGPPRYTVGKVTYMDHRLLTPVDTSHVRDQAKAILQRYMKEAG